MEGALRVRMNRVYVLVAIILLQTLGIAVEGAVRYYDWTVEYTNWAPDCVDKLIISINGEYPGPTIRGTAGDTVVVRVKNNLPTEDLSIHWHGILQKGTSESDGSSWVTQCPISPGETFTYKFVLNYAGTFLYHGHFGIQRSAGLYGSLIVDLPEGQKDPFTYDGELSIILNDWWHKSTYEQLLGLESIPFKFVGEPQSLLIEGRGAYNCSLIPTGAVANSGDSLTCNSSNPQCAPYVLPVEAGKTYRLRIASAVSLSSLNFILEGHKFTVVEADSHYVEPVELTNLDIYSGQTFSVIFTADQDPSKNYWAAINVRGRKPSTPTGLAILNYISNPSTLRPSTSAPVSPAWDDFSYSFNQAATYVARKGYEEKVPSKVDKRLVLLNTQVKVGGKTKWAVNNISYVNPETPVFAALRYKIPGVIDSTPPPDHYTAGYNISAVPTYPNSTYGTGVYVFPYMSVVDVILQNANTLNFNNSEIHPWHLHGHDFWILGYGHGVFDAQTDYFKLNYVNAPRRNTVAMFPWGWTAIRFIADNPGVWSFHCHVESHFHMGMGVVFAERIHKLPNLPKQCLGCGATRQFLHPRILQ